MALSREERALAKGLAEWRAHPAKMVRELFQTEPDAWQEEALEAFPRTPRLAMRACAGPGKTAVLAWIGLNFILTRGFPASDGARSGHPIVGAMSISGANLKSNLWAEFARWITKAPLLQQLFVQTSTEIFNKVHPKTWKIEARTWAKDATNDQIANALSGLHAPYVMWLMDETGEYPEGVLPVCETIFSGNPVEAHIIQAGNPLLLSGPLYLADQHPELWRNIRITADPDDPRRTPRVSVEHARNYIALWGRENDWTRSRIFGEFPSRSINSLIGPEAIARAKARCYREADIAHQARILGVDVAREGDDASVMFPRQGLVAFPPTTWRNIDGIVGAGHLARVNEEWDVDAIIIDNTGGFGAAWIDCCKLLGLSPIGVVYSAKAYDPRYFNKRAEMYHKMAQWIEESGQLPVDCPELERALTSITYTHKNDMMLMEDKAQFKQRIGFSPDHADALAQTFSETIRRKVALPANLRNRRQQDAAWSPFDALVEHEGGRR